jgi:hypothetical protein
MEDQNLIQPPKSDLLVEQDGHVGKLEVLLQKLLRFVYGVYSFFTIIFCLFGVIGLVQALSMKSAVSMLNAVLMAYSSIMAFKSLKHSAIKAFKYAALLLVVGFGTTAIFRIIFVSGAVGSVDLSNFLLFCLPAALTFYCLKLEQRRQKPNQSFKPTPNGAA